MKKVCKKRGTSGVHIFVVPKIGPLVQSVNWGPNSVPRFAPFDLDDFHLKVLFSHFESLSLFELVSDRL